MSFHVPEPYRLTRGRLRSDQSFGNNGAFIFNSVILGRTMIVIASDGSDWDQIGLEGETMGTRFGTYRAMQTTIYPYVD
jgi:hypothetical protein